MRNTTNFLKVGAIALGVMAFGSCSNDDELPPIDGYNNSNEVAATNLVAHWTFDSDNNERISGTAPSNTYGTVTTTTGQVGGALQLNKGVIKFPPIAAINTANALNNFTVSLWVNVTNNKGTTSSGFTALFGLVPAGVTDIWGDIMACAETGRHLPTSDTLELKNFQITHPAGVGQIVNDNIAEKSGDRGQYFMGAKKWIHYVLRWDASTNNYHIFANGTDVGAHTKRNEGGNQVMAVPVHAVFGSLASKETGFPGAPNQQDWNPFATAGIDDVRIYNNALTNAEITALFNLGTAGR